MRQKRIVEDLGAVVLRLGKLGRTDVQYGYTGINAGRTSNVTAFYQFLSFLERGPFEGSGLSLRRLQIQQPTSFVGEEWKMPVSKVNCFAG